MKQQQLRQQLVFQRVSIEQCVSQHNTHCESIPLVDNSERMDIDVIDIALAALLLVVVVILTILVVVIVCMCRGEQTNYIVFKTTPHVRCMLCVYSQVYCLSIIYCYCYHVLLLLSVVHTALKYYQGRSLGGRPTGATNKVFEAYHLSKLDSSEVDAVGNANNEPFYHTLEPSPGNQYVNQQPQPTEPLYHMPIVKK